MYQLFALLKVVALPSILNCLGLELKAVETTQYLH